MNYRLLKLKFEKHKIKNKMDQRSKNVLVLVVIVILGAIALNLIFKFWWTFIVGALAFGMGYMLGRDSKKEKK